MPKVRDTVTLHPETVSQGEKVAKKSRKRAPKPVEPPVTRKYRKRPPWLHEGVWYASLSLAEGDWKRLEIESTTSVLVKNP